MILLSHLQIAIDVSVCCSCALTLHLLLGESRADTHRVMETAGLVPDKMWKRVSIGFLNRVMGDHVYESLWDLIEPAKFAALDGLQSSGELDAEATQKARVSSELNAARTNWRNCLEMLAML